MYIPLLVAASLLESAPLPAPRSGHTMVWDSHRDAVVLYGGIDNNGQRLDDTWTWAQDQGWIELHDPDGTSPPPLQDHAMAFDAARGRVVLFGGIDDESTRRNQLWELDGDNWKLAHDGSAEAPPPLTLAEMVFDPDREACVLALGSAPERHKPQETWAWDGQGWTLIATEGPTPRGSHAMTASEDHGVLLHGGWTDTTASDLWQLRGDTWTPLTAPGSPARLHHSLDTDPDTGDVYLFAGFGSPGRTNDLFRLTDGAWTPITPEGDRPPIRAETGAAWVPGAGLLVFSGVVGDGMTVNERQRLNDTWLFDGTRWHKLAP